MGYVVIYRERYQDCTEETVKVVGSLDAALALASRLVQGNNPHNITVELFELGKQVPLKRETVEVPQPSIKMTTISLA